MRSSTRHSTVGAAKAAKTALAVGIFLTITLLPRPAPACGWWGDAEGDASGEAATVDAEGRLAKGAGPALDTPEALTRQANRLRGFGFSGYAGAARLYRQAAEAGYPPAQNNLGAMYEEGLGVAPDLAEAAQWYRLAAEQGESHAQHSIGEMLLAGRGIAQDEAEGIRWIEQAAKQDHASACADLGRFYTTGQYLGADPQKAVYWWRQAERLGYPEAKAALEALQSPR